MNDRRHVQLREVLDTYLCVPETPQRASEADRALVRSALNRGVQATSLAHAIRLATLRRHLRDPDAPSLAPVRSLAYYLRTLEGLTDDALQPGYVAYVKDRFEALLQRCATPPRQKPRLHDRNAADSGDR